MLYHSFEDEFQDGQEGRFDHNFYKASEQPHYNVKMHHYYTSLGHTLLIRLF